MRIFKLKHISIILLIPLTLGFASCKKEIDAKYALTQVKVLDDDLIKNKQKSPKQFTSILYTDIYNKAISIDFLVKTERVIESVGDKYLVNEMIISNYMNQDDKVLPTNQEMRSNLDSFIVNTYIKFFLRNPNQMERSFFKSYIESNPNVTVELVYTAFVSSDEYLYY
jgi:hypothetical protein